jgi:hypothetical protein
MGFKLLCRKNKGSRIMGENRLKSKTTAKANLRFIKRRLAMLSFMLQQQCRFNRSRQ